jgi:hypothetical protein
MRKLYDIVNRGGSTYTLCRDFRPNTSSVCDPARSRIAFHAIPDIARTQSFREPSQQRTLLLHGILRDAVSTTVVVEYYPKIDFRLFLLDYPKPQSFVFIIVWEKKTKLTGPSVNEYVTMFTYCCIQSCSTTRLQQSLCDTK